MTAVFISPLDDFGGAPLLRRTFTLDEARTVTAAILRVSALGVVEPYLNGSRAGDHLLTPGWSSYEWRLRYDELDVTSLVRPGRNALGLALGNGWYRGRLGWKGTSAVYGSQLAGYAALEIEYENGERTSVVTTDDGTWRAAPSGTTANDLYDGQSIDARAVPAGWSSPAFDDSSWHSSFTEIPLREGQALEPYIAPPVRAQLERKAEKIWTSPSGATLVDFGQNLVGWIRLTARGRAGQVITLRHSEVLENDELGVRPLRTAKATDRFTLSGGDDVFEPTLTFHGFRYAEVSGFTGTHGDLAQALTAVVISSDLPRTGHFACSEPDLNRLHENVVWGMRGNFVDVPTDCPQRDERLGWTGDLSAFAPTATFLADSETFLRDWLRDLALEQAHGDYGVPTVAPDPLKYIPMPDLPKLDVTAIWSDAAVWVPWAVYEAYGDATVLREAWPSMLQHTEKVEGRLSEADVWDTDMQFGDWLDPDAPPEQPWAAKAESGVVATACFFRTASLMAQAAEVLELEGEAARFRALADRVRAGFQTEYVSGERIHSDATTVYTLAIVFGLLDADQHVWAGRRLAELVAESGHHISTGFAGTPFILHALSETGHIDTAAKLLLQRECPSWLYPVTMGATTIWERWDSMLPDGSINPGEMTSFNHYALGAVADWLHRSVAGIAPLEPGYAKVLVQPELTMPLEWAEGSLESRHGLIRVRWDRTSDSVKLRLSVPVPAVVRLPDETETELAPGEHELTWLAPQRVSD
ncbi:alpha-L-rhamnosidase [Kineosporia sp. NBRC 101677]|uniref:alpha-L-rhamnosidase n=1 Tax=Kineosporia sp. NBRC 101677 TaxID=3032197 RepID=UPI0024A06E69|nr:alpha-L-rhamnosidase [Kineosporia sp. NBRC 101677]GLY14983.1 alpha-L-rhamnosidase [Kineosporia sp. NBRC 101677]